MISGKIKLNIRPKVMLATTLFTIILVVAIYFILLYFKAIFIISDMDYIILNDNNSTMLNVNGLKYQYHMDKLLLKDTPDSGKLFLKGGRSYDIKFIFYSCDYFVVMIDGQYGYYTIHNEML